MAEKELKTKVVCTYAGHSVKSNRGLALTLKAGYDELTNYIKLISYLNLDVDVVAKLPEQKPLKLGVFKVKNISVDHDGEGKLTFDSMTDFTEPDNINLLVGPDAFVCMFKAVAEIEDEDDEQEESNEWSE